MDLAKMNLFQDLTEEELGKVRKVAVERFYPKGTTVFMEGQATDGLYIVLKGLVKILMRHEDGREKTLAILDQGEFFGEMTLFGKESRSATVETLEQTTFLVIPRMEFQTLVREIKGLAVIIIETLSQRLRRANRQIQELSFLNSRSRVICNLVNLAEMHGQKEKGEVGIALRLTHAELAKLAGVSRETVTKVLAELLNLNLVKITNRQMKISSVELLYNEVI
ncbi:MAG: Crp/Fnr family transcriptional regulator [Bacillota bacterium]